jgi:xanthine/uracil permease
MSQAKPTRTVVHVDPLAVGIVVLAVATALIHLKLGMALGPPSTRPFPLLYYLNTLGYLVLVTALYVPPLQPVRREVHWVFIAFTILTIAMWFLLSPDHTPLGYSDKVSEVVLVLLLVIDDRRQGQGVGVKRTT